jgi:hypothetical protein
MTENVKDIRIPSALTSSPASMAPLSSDCAINEYVEEAQRNAWFSQLWSCKNDTVFRPFAFAAFAFAGVVDLSPNGRAALYSEVATAKRAELLDRLSGLNGWKSRIRLLPKTTYRSLDEMDWRALFLASEDMATRRALGHMHEISPLLVHQLPLVPEPIRLPNLLAVLNGLRVSLAHWGQLSDALAETPPQLLPSLVAKASGVNSRGSFWDCFFECTSRPWQPFDLSERFLYSPMLKALTTTKELEREGLRMNNCLANEAGNVLAGRKAYFRWQGNHRATVQFTHTSNWRLGRILGPQNQPLPLTEIEAIRWWAEILLAGERKDGRVNNDEADVVIRSLCSQARDNFTIEERASLAAALRDIRGKTHGLGPDTSAYCIFETDNGHIQFMADVDSREYLCEIQSHPYCAAVEPKLTDDVVTLITGSGFRWPRGRQNFSLVQGEHRR